MNVTTRFSPSAAVLHAALPCAGAPIVGNPCNADRLTRRIHGRGAELGGRRAHSRGPAAFPIRYSVFQLRSRTNSPGKWEVHAITWVIASRSYSSPDR